MRDGERHEVGNPPKGLAGFNGLLELGAAALGDLGRTDGARPDRTAGHEAMVKRLAVGVALADVNVCQTVARYRGTKHHALSSAGGWQEAVCDSLDGPTASTGRRWGLTQDFTGLEVNRRVGGSSFGNYTKGPTRQRPTVRATRIPLGLCQSLPYGAIRCHVTTLRSALGLRGWRYEVSS